MKAIVFGVAIVFLSYSAAWSDGFRLIPNVSVKGEYNDNIFLERTNAKRDFIATFSPGIRLVNDTERFKSSLITKFDQRLYSDYNGLNALDQSYQGSLRYLLTTRLNLFATAGYFKDSSPDRDIEITGIVFNEVSRDRQKYTLGGDYALTEKTSASLSYGYSKDQYESGSKFSDIEENSANLSFIHDTSSIVPATKGRVNFGYARYSFAESAIDNYEATIGASKAISELWQIVLDVGGRYTRSDFQVAQLQFIPPFFITTVKKQEQSEGTGAVGRAALSYKGEKTNLDFNLFHGISPASGRYGTGERTSLSVQIRRSFTYELKGMLTGSYFLNKSESGKFSVQEIDEETMSFSPGLRYEYTKDVALDATYSHTRVNYRTNDTHAERNLFMLRLYVQHALLE